MVDRPVEDVRAEDDLGAAAGDDGRALVVDGGRVVAVREDERRAGGGRDVDGFFGPEEARRAALEAVGEVDEDREPREPVAAGVVDDRAVVVDRRRGPGRVEVGQEPRVRVAVPIFYIS